MNAPPPPILQDRSSPPAPERAVRTLAVTLLIGAAGGVAAHAAHVPLAFMLGSLFATMVVSVAGGRLAVPQRFRSVFLFVIGLFLGESFRPDEIAAAAHWWGTALMAVLYAPIGVLLVWPFYQRVAGLGRLTAFFSAIPGGLTAVILLSGAMGADERRVTLIQILRIAIVIVVAPSLFFGAFGFDAPGRDAVEAPIISLGAAAILVAASLALGVVLNAVHIPVAMLLAPVLASAALRFSGLVEGQLPDWMVETSLVVVGAAIGARFSGADPRMLLRLAGWSLLGTFLLLLLSGGFALFAHLAFGVNFFSALLAFAPGGVAEMCLIAIALDADPGFVATHHLVRIGFVLLAMPVIAAMAQRLGADEETEEGAA